MDAVEHGKIVLSTVFGHRSRKALDLMVRRLQPLHFVDAVQRTLYTMCERYLDQAGGVLTREALADALRTSPPGTALMYQEYYDLCSAAKPTPDQFKWSIEQLRELAADRMTGESLSQAMEILTRGAMDGKIELRGHADARAWLLSKMGEIDRELHQQDAPEGDMRTEAQPVLEDYAERKQRSLTGGTGVSTGIARLDEVLGGGLQRGELDLVAGYTSSGKSSLCAQVAWHCTVMQGKNVVIFTSETLRPQVRIKIYARHSAHVLPEGLNTKAIKSGLLNPVEEDQFQQVVNDFSGNQAYGHCYIAQVPRGATLGTVEARLSRIARMFPVDLVIIDYLALLRPDRRRNNNREELSDILKEAKVMAATYNDGQGVPVLSPWQMSRAARDQAQETGYTSRSLAETSEASSTADVIVSLLEPEDDQSNGRRVELRCQVLKNRDGEQLPSLTIRGDYATCHFAEQGGTSSNDMYATLGDDSAFGGQFG